MTTAPETEALKNRVHLSIKVHMSFKSNYATVAIFGNDHQDVNIQYLSRGAIASCLVVVDQERALHAATESDEPVRRAIDTKCNVFDGHHECISATFKNSVATIRTISSRYKQ